MKPFRKIRSCLLPALLFFFPFSNSHYFTIVSFLIVPIFIILVFSAKIRSLACFTLFIKKLRLLWVGECLRYSSLNLKIKYSLIYFTYLFITNDHYTLHIQVIFIIRFLDIRKSCWVVLIVPFSVVLKFSTFNRVRYYNLRVQQLYQSAVRIFGYAVSSIFFLILTWTMYAHSRSLMKTGKYHI